MYCDVTKLLRKFLLVEIQSGFLLTKNKFICKQASIHSFFFFFTSEWDQEKFLTQFIKSLINSLELGSSKLGLFLICPVISRGCHHQCRQFLYSCVNVDTFCTDVLVSTEFCACYVLVSTLFVQMFQCRQNFVPAMCQCRQY